MYSNDTTTLPNLLNEKELCDYLGKSIAWAQRARFEGKGPRYVKAENRFIRRKQFENG